MIATPVVAASVGAAARAFAKLVLAAVDDPAAVFRQLYGIDDGNDYGRYFAGQDPLQPYMASAGTLADMQLQRSALRTALQVACDALVAVGDAGIAGFGGAADTVTEALRQAFADPREAIRALSRLAGFAMIRETQTAPADGIGQQLYVLTALAVMRLRIAAATSLSRATADYAPNSQQSAARAQARVAALLDGLALKCADLFEERTFAVLDSLRVAVVNDLTLRGASLAPVVTRNFAAPLPACVIAYRLYGDASREADLVARNDPPHPAFMPRKIEALAS